MFVRVDNGAFFWPTCPFAIEYGDHCFFLLKPSPRRGDNVTCGLLTKACSLVPIADGEGMLSVKELERLKSMDWLSAFSFSPAVPAVTSPPPANGEDGGGCCAVLSPTIPILSIYDNICKERDIIHLA